MKEMRLILIGVAGVGLLVAASPGALAYAARSTNNQTASQSTNQLIYKVSEQTVKLSPIVVNGQRLILPLYLQLVKTALHRSWSPLQANKNKLVCRFRTMTGSRLQTLKCSTNGQHFQQQREAQLGLYNASAKYSGPNADYLALINGQIPVSIANYTNQHRVSPGAIRALLKKLPPAGSSYTLRVTDHGRPVVDYVIKDGKLKAIHHYSHKQ